MATKTNYQRREFLKSLGLGALATTAVLPSLAFSNSEKKINYTTEKYSLRNIDFQFLFDGDYFLGFGEVKINGVLIRSSRLPFFVQIDSPEAVELTNFKIKNKIISNDEIIIDFSAQAKNGDNMDWMLHTIRNRRNISDWAEKLTDMPDLNFRLIIKPIARQLGGFNAEGFSYQYEYKNPKMPIYKITDKASWEIEGQAIGNEFWMRNGVVETIKSFSKKSDFYSTEWYLPNIANPNIFQFHPLQTALQGFTFTNSTKGTLITWATKVAHIRSLFEKWRNKNEIVHIHEHCGDLQTDFNTSPVEVLWVNGNQTKVAKINLYNNVRELVHETLHNEIGFRRERITTYGVIEEWTEPDFERYINKALPKFKDVGVKKVFIPNQCQNAMNTWGLENMCCNIDFKISDVVGEDKFREFCTSAKKGDIKVEMWGNTAMSTLVELFSHKEGKPKGISYLPYKDSIVEVIDKAESPWVRTASNSFESDHYSPRFCALNLRDKDIRAYWMKQWKHFHDDLGLEGIFLDSSFNMSSDKFHFRQWPLKGGWGGVTLDQKEAGSKYRPENETVKIVHSQYLAHLDWMVEMQKMGYVYCAEDLGVFGINRTGPDFTERIDNLFMWTDSYCDFKEEDAIKAGKDPISIFFKGLAFRVMWKVFWNVKADEIYLGTNNPYAFELLKIYNKVNDWMFNRELLTNENGVIYHKDNIQILWAFNDFTLPLNKQCKILNYKDNSTHRSSELKAQKNVVYQINM